MSYTSNTTLVPRGAGFVLAAVAALLCGLPGVSARAADSNSQVCLDSNRIDHTEIVNKTQILFYMTGKAVWLNTLTAPCSMDRTDGFVWKSSVAQYCDNLETIRILRTGQVCMLGKFTPYVKPAKQS